MPASKDYVTHTKYKMLNGKEVGYVKVVRLISELLIDDVELTPTQITKELGFKHLALSQIIPHMANKSILDYRRTDTDVLLYFKRRPNLLAEMFYPMPRFSESQIKGVYRHKMK